VTSLTKVTIGAGSQASLVVTPAIFEGGCEAAQVTVTAIGQVIDGGVISCTTTVPLQVAVLPQSSVAVQVLLTLYEPTQVPGVVRSEKVIATVRSHASVAVGGIKTGKAGQVIGDVCATQVIVGGVISCTTTVPLQVAVLPQSSVAVQVLLTL